VSTGGGRFLRLVTPGFAEIYHLDDVNPETLQRSLQAYRVWLHSGPVKVWLWDGQSLVQVDPSLGAFILQDALHTLDPLNY